MPACRAKKTSASGGSPPKAAVRITPPEKKRRTAAPSRLREALRLEIAARQQAEDALRQTRFSIEHASDGLFWMTPDARIVDVNAAACRSLGYTRAELLQLTVPDIDPHYDAATWPQHFAELRQRGSLTFETEHRAKDGRLIPVEIVANHLQLGDKERNCAFVRDISERKQAAETLAHLHQRYELILCSAAEGILGLDLQGRHTFVNPAAAGMLGYTAAELLGQPSHTTWHHTKADGHPYPVETCEIYAAYRDGKVHHSATEVFWRKDGTSFPVEYASTPIREQGRLTGAVVTFSDISERLALEREVLKISEREQRRIGEDLHDGLGQQLTAIELMCATLQTNSQGGPELKQQAAQMSKLLREAIRQTRLLAHGLMGFKLTSHGLPAALTTLAQSISLLGRVTCRFECPAPVPFHDATIVSHLYRIAQEAVHNAVKHARARQVTIRLAWQADALRLQITDDGQGLPQPLPRHPGMGLRVMQHRATIIGAQLNVASPPGQGVTVTCVWRNSAPALRRDRRKKHVSPTLPDHLDGAGLNAS